MRAIINAKGITHFFAALAASTYGFFLTPAGQAILHQYPKLGTVFAALTTLLALYHSPQKA